MEAAGGHFRRRLDPDGPWLYIQQILQADQSVVDGWHRASPGAEQSAGSRYGGSHYPARPARALAESRDVGRAFPGIGVRPPRSFAAVAAVSLAGDGGFASRPAGTGEFFRPHPRDVDAPFLHLRPCVGSLAKTRRAGDFL